MISDPLDGDAEEGYSSPIVEAAERLDHLRDGLTCFSHRCRNSLNGIKMSLYLFKRGLDGPMPDCVDRIDQLYREIERSFDRLRVIYRPLSVTVIRHPLGQFVAERLPLWREWFRARGRSLEVVPPEEDLPGDFDPVYLGLGLDAFVAWRAESCAPSSRPRLSWSVANERYSIEWEEGPGEGIGHAVSGRNGCSQAKGVVSEDSLALSLLARVVAAHGGHLERTGDQSVVVRMCWPRFHSCASSS